MEAPELFLRSFHGQQLTPEEIELKQYFTAKKLEQERVETQQKAQKEQRAQQMQDISNRLSNVVHRTAPATIAVTTPFDNPEQKPEINTAIKNENSTSADSQWQSVPNSSIGNVCEPKRRRPGDADSDSDDSDAPKKSAIKKEKSNKFGGKSSIVSSRTSESHLDPEIFDPAFTLMSEEWSTYGENAKPLELILNNFGYGNFQTLAVKLTVPEDSEHYSINILATEEDYREGCDGVGIFFHMNPRRYKTKKDDIVMFNDRDVTWGRPRKVPLDQMPQLFGTTIELVVQVRAEGFVTFVNGVFVNFFEHRRDISKYKKLILQIPTQDDNGYPCIANFTKIWWGWKEPETDEDEMYGAVAMEKGRTGEDPDKERTIFVGGLPKCHDQSDIDDLNEKLCEIFEEYGVEKPITIIGRKGIAFLKVHLVFVLLQNMKVHGEIHSLNSRRMGWGIPF